MLNTNLEVDASEKAIAVPVPMIDPNSFTNTAFAELLGTYSLKQVNKLEWIESVSIKNAMREYHAFVLEGGCYGDEYQISFSLYRDKKVNGEADEYESMTVEFLYDGANIESEQDFIAYWSNVLEPIKADLFKNTFPEQVA